LWKQCIDYIALLATVVDNVGLFSKQVGRIAFHPATVVGILGLFKNGYHRIADLAQHIGTIVLFSQSNRNIAPLTSIVATI
jgi:hypothetical protein